MPCSTRCRRPGLTSSRSTRLRGALKTARRDASSVSPSTMATGTLSLTPIPCSGAGLCRSPSTRPPTTGRVGRALVACTRGGRRQSRGDRALPQWRDMASAHRDAAGEIAKLRTDLLVAPHHRRGHTTAGHAHPCRPLRDRHARDVPRPGDDLGRDPRGCRRIRWSPSARTPRAITPSPSSAPRRPWPKWREARM
jgi:hypothetical protein